MNMETTINPTCPWYDMEQQFGPANLKWCEDRVCALVNEPANAWSNIFFVLVGLFIIYRGYKSKSISLRNFDFLFGVIVIIMGSFSFIYHATNNYLTQIVDFVGMYFYIYFLFCISLYHFKLISARMAGYIFIGSVVISTLLIPISRYIHFPYQAIVAIVAVALSALQVRGWAKDKDYPKKELVICLGFFILGAVFSFLDASRIFCDPSNHFVQGHAIWHLCSSFGAWFSYLVFSKQYQSSLK